MLTAFTLLKVIGRFVPPLRCPSRCLVLETLPSGRVIYNLTIFDMFSSIARFNKAIKCPTLELGKVSTHVHHAETRLEHIEGLPLIFNHANVGVAGD